MHTLIFGLGNPILSDDGIGIKVSQEIKKYVNSSDSIDVKWGSLSGLEILDELTGYDKVVIIDAVKMGGEIGKVYKLELNEFNNAIHLTSPHTINIPTAIYMGKKVGLKMPEEIVIYGIEVKQIDKFSEELSEELIQKMDDIVREIMECVNEK